MRTYSVICHNFREAGSRYLLEHLQHLASPENARDAFEMAKIPGFDPLAMATAAERLGSQIERCLAVEMTGTNVLLLVEAAEGSSRLYTCAPSEREQLTQDAIQIARTLRRFAKRQVKPDLGPDQRS